MQRCQKMCCYFYWNPKRKGSISQSNFDEQLPNILFTCLCICARILRVVTVASLQSARGAYYILVWWEFYTTRGIFLNIWVEKGMNRWIVYVNAKLRMKIKLSHLFSRGFELVGYGSNDNRLRAWETVDWMVYHNCNILIFWVWAMKN